MVPLSAAGSIMSNQIRDATIEVVLEQATTFLATPRQIQIETAT